MSFENFFRDMFESIPDYRKRVLIIILIQNDKDPLTESGFLKDNNNQLRKDFKNLSIEKIEDYLAYIKDQEESINEKILNK